MNKFTIELHDPEITKIGVEATIDFYQTMAIDQLQSPHILAVATGDFSSYLNVVIDTRPRRENSLDLIKSVTPFFAKHQVPWSWLITPASHENDLIQLGFSLLEELPVMYFDLSHPLQNVENNLISVREADENDDLQTWKIPINEGFQAPEGEDYFRKLNVDILKSGSGKLRQFIAYYQNNIAAAGTLFLSKNAVMLHNLATRTAYTKRGVGTALTLHMMGEAKKLGFKHCFLDSSESGFNLYKRVGFQVYSTTLIYSKTN
jgi:ribosomal protein S18 acetylase RimI-like enzyme